MKNTKSIRFVNVCLLLLLAALAPALSMVHRPIQDLAALAERIVYVKVLSAKAIEIGAGDRTLPATEYSLEVLDAMKGDVRTGQTITLRQIGSVLESKDNKAGTTWVEALEMPIYNAGDRYLLFLAEESSETGLCSPVGLGQGALREFPGADGQPATFMNSYDNMGLFKGISETGVAWNTGLEETPSRRAAVSLDENAKKLTKSGKGPAEKEATLSLVRQMIELDVQVAAAEKQAADKEKSEAGKEVETQANED